MDFFPPCVSSWAKTLIFCASWAKTLICCVSHMVQEVLWGSGEVSGWCRIIQLPTLDCGGIISGRWLNRMRKLPFLGLTLLLLLSISWLLGANEKQLAALWTIHSVVTQYLYCPETKSTFPYDLRSYLAHPFSLDQSFSAGDDFDP